MTQGVGGAEPFGSSSSSRRSAPRGRRAMSRRLPLTETPAGPSLGSPARPFYIIESSCTSASPAPGSPDEPPVRLPCRHDRSRHDRWPASPPAPAGGLLPAMRSLVGVAIGTPDRTRSGRTETALCRALPHVWRDRTPAGAAARADPGRHRRLDVSRTSRVRPASVAPADHQRRRNQLLEQRHGGLARADEGVQLGALAILE